jgi:hypothetical protein
MGPSSIGSMDQKLYCKKLLEVLASFTSLTTDMGKGCGVGGCGYLSAHGGRSVASESVNWSLFGAGR